MFIKKKTIKGNDYFYLVESRRVEGKSRPTPKTIAYLGNQEAAIAKLETSDYPTKEILLERVRATVPVVGKNQGKLGRPKGSDRGDSPKNPPAKVADIV